jgi:hypothetical protein
MACRNAVNNGRQRQCQNRPSNGHSRTSVYEAIRALERVGLLTWCNRLVRVRERVAGLFGPLSAYRWRVVRTSNAYAFTDPASKFSFQIGTPDQGQQERESCGQIGAVAPVAAGSRTVHHGDGHATVAPVTA